MSNGKAHLIKFLIICLILLMAFYGFRIWLAMFSWVMFPLVFFLIVGYVIYNLKG